MKYVINRDYSGFHIPRELVNVLPDLPYDGCDEIRADPRLVEWVLAHQGQTTLKVVEIPEEATDYLLQEYDGWETVIVVRDGKIEFA